MINYAKYDQLVRDDNGSTYSPNLVRVEQFVDDEWVEMKNVTEVNVLEGWAKIIRRDENPLFISNHLIYGKFRVLPI